jgi:uroporphyrinogen-III decarboxylase
MEEMTIRDRMLAVYRNQLPDRFPVSIYNRYLPRGLAERAVRNMGIGIIEYHPVTTLLAPPWHTNPGFLSEVKGAELSISHKWENNEVLEVRSYETKVGTLRQCTKKDPVYGSDWISKFYIARPEDYKIMQYIVENTVFRSNEKELSRKIEDLGADGVVMGRIDRSPFQKLMIELAGPERFLMDISSGLKEAEELLEAMAGKLGESFDMVAESSAEVIWQPENVTGDMTPPKFFGKYCMPFYKEFAKKIEGTGKVYVVHLDGRLKSLLELIAECPFDCIESFSYPEVGNDITFGQGRETWPGKVILPNFPSPLCEESEEKIVAFLERAIEEAGNDKAYMLQISEDIPHEQWKRTLPIIVKFMNDRGKTKSAI